MWAPGCSHMEHPLAPAPSWSSCEGQDDGDNIVFIDSCYLGLLEKKALACEVRRIGCLLWESRDSCEVWGAGAGAGTGNGAGKEAGAGKGKGAGAGAGAGAEAEAGSGAGEGVGTVLGTGKGTATATGEKNCRISRSSIFFIIISSSTHPLWSCPPLP